MSLPKLQHPVFTLTLPSTGEKITYRPFLVREEKILLMAQQGKDSKDIVRAMKQVINNCIMQETPVDVNAFTTFDLEYFFLKLRAKSVNNIVELTYIDNEDQKEYKFEIDLDAIEVKGNDNHTNLVRVDKNTQLTLRYPRVDIMDKVDANQNEIEFSYDILGHCLDKLMIEKGDEEEVFVFSSYSQKEINEFIMSLGVRAEKQIQKFFDTMPKLEHTLEYTNSKGTKQKIVLNKLEDFFILG